MSHRNSDLVPPTGSVLPHQLIWVLQFVALLLPPSLPYRRLMSSAAIIACAVWTNVSPHFTNDVGEMQPYALAWAFYLGTLDKIIFGVPSPEAAFWRRHGEAENKAEAEAEAYVAFGWKKFKWAFGLIFGVRGVGWNWQVERLPAAAVVKKGRNGSDGARTRTRTRTRWRFVAVTFASLIYHMVWADFLVTLGTRLWYIGDNGIVGDVNSKYITLRSADWREQFVKCAVWGMLPYHAIQMQYALCALVAVAAGLSAPRDWPPFFGNLAEVTTVRQFWGDFWHQTIRRGITSFTRAFVQLLGIRRGTNLSSYTQLWLAFGVSGAAHALQMRMFPSPTNITFEEKLPPMFAFFMFQAAAITFEDFVQWIWKRCGSDFTRPSTFRVMVGYLWVIFSFWYSIPLAADVMIRMRAMEKNPLPFSIFEPLLLGPDRVI